MFKKSRPTVYALGGTLALIVLIGAIKFFQIRAAIANGASHKPPPESVTSTIAQAEKWRDNINAVGSLMASEGVILSAEESGKVTAISFESGQSVKKGQLLVEIDSSVEQAQLKGALATQDQTKLNLNRMESLASRGAASASDLDRARADAREAQARVESLQATIAHKHISAPFSGRAGIREINLGQFVTPGTRIVPLFALDPLFLNFSLPQNDVSSISAKDTVSFTVDAFAGRRFSGSITAINPQIDPETRAVKIQATVPNADESLRPGMFAKVNLQLPEERRLITLPVSSINYAPYGDTVYVIADLKDPNGDTYRGVQQRVVELGERRGDQIAILSGLNPGEEVVTSGVFKLRPGLAVRVDNSVTPGDSLQPKPSDT